MAIINNEITELNVASGPLDAVYVLWYDHEEPSDAEYAGIDIYFKRSLDGGASFDETVIIEKGGTTDMGVSRPRMAVGVDGTVYIVYCKYDYQDD